MSGGDLRVKIKYLDKEKYDYFPLNYSYFTSEHYEVKVLDEKGEMSYVLTRKPYGKTLKKENVDTLYQDTFPNAEAYAATDDDGNECGYVEFDTEEWNNRLRMTQLLVKPEYRGCGVGKFLVDYVKNVAKERDYRIIVLETQNYNVPAIDFYRSQGFVFCGGNVYFYSNDDIDDDEVMLEMAFLM
jgi:ribosomal protein S18 acetylase RimI-like enzyme